MADLRAAGYSACRAACRVAGRALQFDPGNDRQVGNLILRIVDEFPFALNPQ